MQNFTVKKAELLQVMRTNRDNHRALFLKAQENYRKLVTRELEQMLEDARNGVSFRKHVNLDAPSDHTVEYDNIIGVLEMCTEEDIPLTLAEYKMFVKDQWGWVADMVKNSTYATSFVGVAENAMMPSSF